LILAAAAAGAVAGGLNQALNEKDFCLPCILKAAGLGALAGAASALPFLLLPAAAGIGLFAAAGGAGGAISYGVNCLDGTEPNPSLAGFGEAVAIGAVTAGVMKGGGDAIAGKLAPTDPPPSEVNFMKSDDPFFLNASKRADVGPDGQFDVIAHGNETQIEINTAEGAKLVDASEAADYIRAADGYDGQDVRLLSCSTGADADGFAQQLANELGVKVTAPNDILWSRPDGSLEVAPGKYVTDPTDGSTDLQYVEPTPDSGFVEFMPQSE